MESSCQRSQRVSQADHRRRRSGRGHKRTAHQDHRRADEEDQSDGGIKMSKVYIGGVGIWGQRHYQFLKDNKPTVINVMRMKGTLRSYLREVNDQAEEMLFQLVNQMAKAEGVTEQLKARDQMAWVGAMNNVRNRAEEIVLNEIIYK